ncbi:hypothetical protein D3C72_1710270 [compost metagenome]
MISLNNPSPIRSKNHIGNETTPNSIKITVMAQSDTTISVRGRYRRNKAGKNGAIRNTPTACMAALTPIALSLIPALSSLKAINGELSP